MTNFVPLEDTKVMSVRAFKCSERISVTLQSSTTPKHAEVVRIKEEGGLMLLRVKVEGSESNGSEPMVDYFITDEMDFLSLSLLEVRTVMWDSNHTVESAAATIFFLSLEEQHYTEAHRKSRTSFAEAERMFGMAEFLDLDLSSARDRLKSWRQHPEIVKERWDNWTSPEEKEELIIEASKDTFAGRPVKSFPDRKDTDPDAPNSPLRLAGII